MQQSDTLVLACPLARLGAIISPRYPMKHPWTSGLSVGVSIVRLVLSRFGLDPTRCNRHKAKPRMPLIEASWQLSLHDTGQQLIFRTLPSRVPSRRVFPTDAPCLQVAWPPMKAPCVRKHIASKLASPPQLCSNIIAFTMGAISCCSDNTVFFRSRTYMPLSIKLVLSTIIEKNKANL